ncbi:MAG: flagellar basal body rod protein FlgB [Kofleriaceae bacterium]
MSIGRTSLDSLEAALTYHRERHTVLAGNIANLDTPGYRPQDLTRSASLETGAPAATDARHISIDQISQTVSSFDDGGAQQGADGNAVTLERELAKIDANRTRYATSAELVSRRLAMLRYAAGDGT